MTMVSTSSPNIFTHVILSPLGGTRWDLHTLIPHSRTCGARFLASGQSRAVPNALDDALVSPISSEEISGRRIGTYKRPMVMNVVLQKESLESLVLLNDEDTGSAG